MFLKPHIKNPFSYESDTTSHDGFSWGILNSSLVFCFKKDGGTRGFSSRTPYIPQRQINIIVSSNYESSAPVIADHITDIVLESRVELKQF